MPTTVMPAPAAPVNYEALAEEARQNNPAPVDYEALAAQAREKHPPEKTVGGFMSNVVSSTGNLLGNIATTVAGGLEKPLRLADNLVTGENKQPREEEQQFDSIGDTFAGLTYQAFHKAGLPFRSENEPEAQADIHKAEGLEDSLKTRYGGWQNIKDTLYNDPVGVAADAAMFTGGTAASASRAARLAEAAKLSRTASGLRTTARVARAATEYNPIVAVPTKVIPGAYRGAKTAVGDYVDRVADKHVALIQALRPIASRTNFDKSVAMAMPDIKAVESAPGAIQDIDTLLDTTGKAKKLNRVHFQKFTTPAQQKMMSVDLNPVADAIEGSIPETTRFEDVQRGVPTKAYRKALDYAKKYRASVSVEKAEALLRDVNAQLDEYYAKYPGVKRAMLRSNPETAALVAKADALRDALYTTLDNPGLGAGPRELNRRYGAMIDIEDAALRRKNVAARQAPQNITEQFSHFAAARDFVKGSAKLATGNVGGAVDLLKGAAARSAAKFAKEQQSTNNLIRRAFKYYDVKASPLPQPPPVDLSRAILPEATSQIGVSGVTVPDIIGRSRRGMGTPHPLIPAATGNPSGGVAQPTRFGRPPGRPIPGKYPQTSTASGPGAKTVGPKPPFPMPPAGTFKNPYR